MGSTRTLAGSSLEAGILPFVQEPVGLLEYDGHEIDVWSIACTLRGEVIFLNCCAADAAVSATLKRLLRKNTGKATFRPAPSVRWSGPTNLSKLTDHYDTITQALSHNGLRIKNQCILPDCANIAAGLARPMELAARIVSEHSEISTGTDEGTDSTQETFRYLLGDIRADRPPTGTLFAHLKSLVVVAHPSWESVLWQAATERGLLVAQPTLGIRAWSIPKERKRWTELVAELWMAGDLSRPIPQPMLSGKDGRRTTHRERARKER